MEKGERGVVYPGKARFVDAVFLSGCLEVLNTYLKERILTIYSVQNGFPN